ncbi:spore germination protein [Mesobacillus maritimus]|uniref:spore germination protein n=1 Tax=Mesobacillus maritimus TaxID=1643336 RepID=UPI00203E12F1|nr:spore germination protein [Mesobacillus maritimus]MCM3588302.1 spore germination protein [Mesobacillus maritimus]MCM3672083.1 spore germination protein [Mesobacillus maritimus]
MSFAPVSLNILGIKINAVDHAGVVNLGPSQHLDQFVSYKRNQGIGEQNGDRSPTILSTSWVNDPDVSDSNAVKTSLL